MGVQKRPKLRRGQLASGAEFYYYRKPSTAQLPKSRREDSGTVHRLKRKPASTTSRGRKAKSER